MDPVNVPAKFEVRRLTPFWGNSGSQKNFGQLPGYAQIAHTPYILISRRISETVRDTTRVTINH